MYNIIKDDNSACLFKKYNGIYFQFIIRESDQIKSDLYLGYPSARSNLLHKGGVSPGSIPVANSTISLSTLFTSTSCSSFGCPAS